jgi:hypothetical protein
MRFARSLFIGGIATLLLSAAPGGAGAALPAACRPGFRAIPTPDLGSSHGELHGVSALGGADAWAVGNVDGETATLREHWDGSHWSVVPGPDPGVSNALESVSGTGANDVWAVGAWNDGVVDHDLIEHWDGTSWTTSSSQALGMLGVKALAPNDVWAVGELQNIRHWDGTSWSPVAHPPSEDGDFHAVDGLSADDVWIAGAQEAEGSGDFAVVMHWDGVVVSRVPLVVPGADESEMLGIAEISPTDVWAVGEQDKGGIKHALIAHWDGTRWTEVRSPQPGAEMNELVDVSAVSADDVWAAGTWATDGVEHPFVVHWNGSKWSVVPARSPNPHDAITTLEGISAVSAHDFWAVGAHGADDTSLLPLAERGRGCP